MKKILILFALICLPLISNGQECGIYRLRYKGYVISETYKIDSLALPRTTYLHGFESDTSKYAFTNVRLTDNIFNIQIRSHLTTPYSEKGMLLDFYKTKSPTFNLKMFFSHKGKAETKTVKISWEDITVLEI